MPKLRSAALCLTLLACLSLVFAAAGARERKPVMKTGGFGVGATFPYPVYAAWADAYSKAKGVGLNYQSIGSGGGIAQIEAGTVTFGASDVPLSKADLDKYGLIQFPTVVGGVAVIVHLKDIAPGQLTLNGPVLAGIFSGTIRRWNDPAIRALNPGVKLPDMAIALVVRAEKSGTSYSFSSYLARYSADWRKTMGVGAAVSWPSTAIGAKGAEGVANQVLRTSGAIGYVEYAYVKQNRLTYARLVNRDGKTVVPGADSFRAAATSINWVTALQGGEAIDLTDRPGADVWPVTAPTYILIRKIPVNVEDTTSVLAFFGWAFDHGDVQAQGLDYVPLPDAAKTFIRSLWKQVRGGSR